MIRNEPGPHRSKQPGPSHAEAPRQPSKRGSAPDRSKQLGHAHDTHDEVAPCCAAGRTQLEPEAGHAQRAASPAADTAAAAGCGPGIAIAQEYLDLPPASARRRLMGGGAAPSIGRTSRKASREGMVLVPGGEFLMGTDDKEGFPSDGEGPVRRVRVRPFYIDATAVTNEQFAEFVKATGYKTEAERIGWSYVFGMFLTPRARDRVIGSPREAPWWMAVKGAYWAKPEGPDSSIRHRRDHPVVHVSWNDALAYCAWAGKRLPTEAEWEFAARGGLEQKRYPWGDELLPNGEHHCNIWQGIFPYLNTGDDGYIGTAPANAFQPNGFGLYNVSGNVWEWCADWFSPTYHAQFIDQVQENPTGPPEGFTKVLRGGSYLCHKSYCNRYRVAARSQNTPDSSTGNMGFRCVVDVDG